MSEDNDIVDFEIINPSKSEHKSDYVSNVFYGPRTKANAKKVKDREEAFYRWAKGLNPNLNRDVITETNHFQYRRYTDDGKKQINE
jgi:hypothetical protein